MIKIDSNKIFLRFLFFFSGFYSILIVVTEFFNIRVFGDHLLIYITLGFFQQILPFYFDRIRIKKNAKNSKDELKKMILINVFLLISTFYLMLIVITVIYRNTILAIFELLFLMISIGSIKLFFSLKKKNNSMFNMILLKIEFIITVSLSVIIFILNFFQHSSLIFLISLGLLLGGISNLLYSFIWKLKN